ncbi:hypothetical protein HELRODRAFT_189539 [Helobdella robusta]|uniref:Uncharacterized protein n=1 Tax=Helobdella robusta TaxID=6412 RepID=T1FR49_HELRO|nr:hypothetical protein HELRODRAFT_189539 [Helobdella robusta]ESN92632.1 hypothetical protein HELRODRAFT_189539 [Helobdella robusta]
MSDRNDANSKPVGKHGPSHEDEVPHDTSSDQQNSPSDGGKVVKEDQSSDSSSSYKSEQTKQKHQKQKRGKDKSSKDSKEPSEPHVEEERRKSPDTILRELTESSSSCPPPIGSSHAREQPTGAQPEADVEIDISSQRGEDGEKRMLLERKTRQEQAAERDAEHEFLAAIPNQPVQLHEPPPRTWVNICFHPEYWFLRAMLVFSIFIAMIIVFAIIWPLYPVLNSVFSEHTTCLVVAIEIVSCSNDVDDKPYCVNNTCMRATVSYLEWRSHEWKEGFLVNDDANDRGNCFAKPDFSYSPCRTQRNFTHAATTTTAAAAAETTTTIFTNNNSSRRDDVINDHDDVSSDIRSDRPNSGRRSLDIVATTAPNDHKNVNPVGCNITCYYHSHQIRANLTDARAMGTLMQYQQRLGLVTKYSAWELAILILILVCLIAIAVLVVCCFRARRNSDSRIRRYGYESI